METCKKLVLPEHKHDYHTSVQVMALETTLTETREGMEASQSMGRLWETQMASIEKEVARLVCETNQLKDCNAALHDQVRRVGNSRH